MKSTLTKILGFGLTFFLVFPSVTNAQLSTDVTSQLEDLGIPSKNAGYAKNIWDFQIWENKIYVGTGNSSNEGPETNAGPIPIISLNPQTKQYSEEPITLPDGTVKTAVDEEQIEVFRILDNMLVIPGHDSTEAQTLGNFYVKEATGWKKYRNIPSGIHVYDMISFQGKWFAALGVGSDTYVVLSSTDQGKTWQGVPGMLTTPTAHIGRIHRFFSMNNKLYVNEFAGMYEYNGSGFNPASIAIQDAMFPNWTGYKYSWPWTPIPESALPYIGKPVYARMERLVNFNSQYVYVGADYINDHQWISQGLYKAPSMTAATKITLPNNALPWDILVRGNTSYVLADIKINNTNHTNVVYKTTDLNTWTEVLRFSADTFARSFEELDGYFYFGLGSDTTTIPADTGKIFRVRANIVSSTSSPITRQGDANNDGDVDGLDYIIWLNHYNQNVSGVINGNFNGDTKVDGLDYIIWLTNYGI